MGKKLDLSKLTDEEAKHVWEVIQRDFDLRKKEDERLGELKTKLEKEDTKLELLGTQTSLTDSHCIRCLQPFKFLLNSKRQCLDCRLYTCKSCSRYNKKERGWVCDPCRTSRVLKMGTLDWYHEHIRSRFKRFGSAKVMRSLYKRLHSEQRLKSELAGSRDDDTYSMPDVRDMYDMPEEDDVTIDASEAQRCRLHSGGGEGVTRKESMIAEADIASVFQQILEEQGQVGGNPEQEFSTKVHLRINSRRKSLEKSSKSGSPTGQLKGQQRSQYYADMDSSDEEGEGVPVFPLYQSHFPRRRSRASSPENLHHSKPQEHPVMVGSDIGWIRTCDLQAIRRILHSTRSAFTGCASQETLGASFMLCACLSGMQSDADLEEKKLKKKLGELAGNISDKGLSSKEDVGRRKKVLREAVMSSSSDDLPNEAQKRSAAALCDITTEALRTLNATERALTELVPPKPKERHQLQGTDVTRADEAYRELEEHVYMAAGKTYSLEKKLKDLEETAKSRYSGTTDSELSELEDKVASAAATVQNTESEVSNIENRIAALSAAGLTVVPERNRRKFSGQVGGDVFVEYVVWRNALLSGVF
ncbi:UNVERIFIED_CONTAM: hypothetical protein FKN15_023814 [Acipenser sinensis]